MNPPLTRTPEAEANPVLAGLVDEITRALQAGESIDLGSYQRQWPEQFEELSRLLPTLEAMVQLGRSGLGDSAADSRPEADAEGGILGDFHIGREIGRGGMGVVYQARQISLGRCVALKVLPFAAVLDPRRLERFKNEAQAAAALDHPNIVAVHAVGCDRGVHYYAMQYIDGHNVAEILEQRRREPARPAEPAEDRPPAASSAATRPLARGSAATERVEASREFARAAAGWIAQAADALEYAHQVGVVHRDIKPSNLLVDARGHLWVTDFGLAATGRDTKLTATGDILGTLRYMSPEQARGDRRAIDHRADIYSLGVTLYELLTLRTPFEAAERSRLLAKIADEEPRRPRQIDPAIPKDLETIVLKAMAKEPESRYGTAGQLRDDLNRFLADEPIRARRPSLRERSARWARRHRSWVAALFLGLAISTAGLALSTLLIAGARNAAEQAATRERDARMEIERQRQRAEANFQKALAAVDELLTRVGDQDLAGVPEFEPVRRELLQRAVAFYQGFLAEKNADPSLRHQTARAHARVGEILELLGRYADAEKALDQALPIQEQLASEFPDEAEYAHALAVLETRRGNLYSATDRTAEAVAAYDRARTVLEGLVDRFGSNAEYRMRLAHSQENRGLMLKRTGRMTEAERAFRQSLATYEELAALLSDVPLHRRNLAAACVNLGVLLEDSGRVAEAEKQFRRARAIHERLVADQPDVPEYRECLFVSRNDLALLLARTGRAAAAEAMFREARDTVARLAADFPSIPRFQQKLAVATCSLGDALLQSGKLSEAAECCRQSLELHRRLADDQPGIPENESHLAHCQYSLGRIGRAEKRLTDAERALGEAARIYGELAKAHPEVLSYAAGEAKTSAELASLRMSQGRAAEAEECCRRAIAAYELLLGDLPAAADLRQQLGGVQLKLSEILAARPAGLAEAQQAARAAARLCEQLVADFPDVAEHRENLAAAQRTLSRLQAGPERTTPRSDGRSPR